MLVKLLGLLSLGEPNKCLTSVIPREWNWLDRWKGTELRSYPILVTILSRVCGRAKGTLPVALTASWKPKRTTCTWLMPWLSKSSSSFSFDSVVAMIFRSVDLTNSLRLAMRVVMCSHLSFGSSAPWKWNPEGLNYSGPNTSARSFPFWPSSLGRTEPQKGLLLTERGHVLNSAALLLSGAIANQPLEKQHLAFTLVGSRDTVS